MIAETSRAFAAATPRTQHIIIPAPASVVR